MVHHRAQDGLVTHDLSQLLNLPAMDFHAQHFMKASKKQDTCPSNCMWFWSTESKELSTPMNADEPILSHWQKSPAIACRLCWADNNWKAYKTCDSIVTTLRNHLMTSHKVIYEGYLQKQR